MTQHLLPLTENPAVIDPRGQLTKAHQNALLALDFYRQQRRVLGGWKLGDRSVTTATVNTLIKLGLVRLSGAGLQMTQGGQLAVLKLKGKGA